LEELQLVVFKLGKEEYGVDIAQVREIVRWQQITKVPQAPSFVEGIVNLRGQIIPIVDLAKRFSLMSGETSREESRRIVVVHIDGRAIGILVDGVSEILRIPTSQIEPPPPIVAGTMGADFLRGVGKVDGRLIIILDLNRIFSQEEMSSLKGM